MINFRLRDSLYRDTAPVPATSFATGDKFAAPISLVPRHSYNSQNLYPDGKKCAIPSLHRDNFSAKVPGPCPVLASGNTTSLYCRAVSCKANLHQALILPGLPTHKQEFGGPSLQPSLRRQTHAFLPKQTPPYRQLYHNIKIPVK